MPNYSSVSCAEESGSRSEQYDDKRGYMSASVQLRCTYEDRHLLVADVVGNRRAWPHAVAGTIPRANTAGIVPVITPPAGGAAAAHGQAMVYGEALVTINYTTDLTELITESIEPTAEFITLDHRWFRWGDIDGDLLQEEEAPGHLLRGINFVRSINEYRGELPGALLGLVGLVNDATITPPLLNGGDSSYGASTSGGISFAPETLLYAPPSISRKFNVLGESKFDISMKWTYKPEGWNKYYRTKKAGWYYMYNVAEGGIHRSYELGDFSELAGLGGL